MFWHRFRFAVYPQVRKSEIKTFRFGRVSDGNSESEIRSNVNTCIGIILNPQCFVVQTGISVFSIDNLTKCVKKNLQKIATVAFYQWRWEILKKLRVIERSKLWRYLNKMLTQRLRSKNMCRTFLRGNFQSRAVTWKCAREVPYLSSLW